MGLKYNIGARATPPIFQYNNLWGNDLNFSNFSPDTTNIYFNPMLVNQDSFNLYLQKFSPLIDTGDPTIHDKDSTRSDIGLYGGPFGESYSYNDLAPRIPVNLNATFDSLHVGITWSKNTQADFNHYNVYRDSPRIFKLIQQIFLSQLLYQI